VAEVLQAVHAEVGRVVAVRCCWLTSVTLDVVVDVWTTFMQQHSMAGSGKVVGGRCFAGSASSGSAKFHTPRRSCWTVHIYI
jgi:hypothetical protein